MLYINNLSIFPVSTNLSFIFSRHRLGHSFRNDRPLKLYCYYHDWKFFEVLRAVAMKSSIFWDITMCSLQKVNRRFGGTSPPSSGSKDKLSMKLAWKQRASRTLRCWTRRWYVPPKRCFTLKGLHDTVLPKIKQWQLSSMPYPVHYLLTILLLDTV
jgi:hypothetical protein